MIDFHTHIFPDHLAQRALDKLSAIGGIPVCSNGRAEALLADMEGNGVHYSVVLNIATNPKQVDNVNAFALSIKEHYDRLIPFGSLHPMCKDVRRIIKSLRDNGIKGIKLHPDYVRTTVDDPSFYPVFASAAEMDMIVVIHAGWDFVSPDFLHASPDAILRVIKRFPGLKLICAHFGANRRWDEVLHKLCGTPLYFDTALACERFGMTGEIAKAIIENHDEERILFGTDMPWCETAVVRDFIDSLEISRETKGKIFHGNACKLLGIK